MYNNNNNNNNKYLYNMHKLCIVKVQGGEKVIRKDVNNRELEPPSLSARVKMDNLKLTVTRLYELYFCNTK